MADILSGDFPGLTWIGGVADIVSGTLTGDETRIKQGWDDVSPVRTIAIVKQMIDIANGERDWMSLFLYENYAHARKGRKSQGDIERTQNAIRDMMAQSEFGKDWADLTTIEQAQLLRDYPDLE